MHKALLFFLCLFQINLSSQDFGLGILLDDSLYANSPTAVPLMRGDYFDLPKSSSLKSFAPTPGYQGPYGTCAGWSTGYAARTILEAMKYNWSKNEIDSNTFSPSFIYNQIRVREGCEYGTSLIHALEVLKNQGGLKLKDFAYECEKEISTLDKEKAKQYRIIEFRDISPKGSDKVLNTKKSIAEGRPVVIAMDVPVSFNTAKELWLPLEDDYRNWSRGHAMTVIGYDDTKFGGAFEIINSWGKRWGKDGFTWIRYSDYDYFCKYAFEIIDRRNYNEKSFDLSGTLHFKESGGNDMPATFNGNYFVMDKSYPSGTMFELIISNNEPAYVYAISSDTTYKTYKIFPFTDRMVAYLPYRQNNVAIPDEDSYNMLDQTTGKSYFCFLYSKESLDLNSIMQKIENSKGNFWQRLKSALDESRVEEENISFSYEGKISFKAKSKDKSIVPVLVEIDHTD